MDGGTVPPANDEDGYLDERMAARYDGIPGVLVHGRLDVNSPPDIAWQLAQAWPDAELMLLDDAATAGVRA